MVVRETTVNDLPEVMAIYDHARRFMAAHGNAGQWTGGYPSKELIASEIAAHHSFVCIDEEGSLVGTFCFIEGEDPSYQRIDGHWLNDAPYGTIHRIASSGMGKGIFSTCVVWCSQRCRNLRLDTHRDNYPMQNAVEKNGFVRCGIIHLASDGSPRIAYQKIIDTTSHQPHSHP